MRDLQMVAEQGHRMIKWKFRKMAMPLELWEKSTATSVTIFISATKGKKEMVWNDAGVCHLQVEKR